MSKSISHTNSASAVELSEGEKDGALFDGFSGVDVDGFDGAVGGGFEVVLHFHGFEDDEGVAFGDGLAGGDGDGEDHAGHGGFELFDFAGGAAVHAHGDEESVQGGGGLDGEVVAVDPEAYAFLVGEVGDDADVVAAVVEEQEGVAGAQGGELGLAGGGEVQEEVVEAVFQHGYEGTHRNSSYLRVPPRWG